MKKIILGFILLTLLASAIAHAEILLIGTAASLLIAATLFGTTVALPVGYAITPRILDAIYQPIVVKERNLEEGFSTHHFYSSTYKPALKCQFKDKTFWGRKKLPNRPEEYAYAHGRWGVVDGQEVFLVRDSYEKLLDRCLRGYEHKYKKRFTGNAASIIPLATAGYYNYPYVFVVDNNDGRVMINQELTHSVNQKSMELNINNLVADPKVPQSFKDAIDQALIQGASHQQGIDDMAQILKNAVDAHTPR